jgi:hypothetical protein
MAIDRINIEKALDKLISEEGHVTFQALAVVLSQLRWPELIACERKRDLGLDAYATAALAADGIGKGLACSLTGTLEKIKADSKKVKEHFADVRVLIFATPQKVSNYTAKIWADKIQSEFGYELIVVPREDIILSLMDPSNAVLCRSFLGIRVQIEAQLQEVLDRAQLAAAEVTTNWVQSLRLGARPLIDLRFAELDEHGRKTDEIFNLDGIRTSLVEAGRVVIEAPAGRGKTTALVQLAKLQEGVTGLSFLVDLPAWARSGQNILNFIAQKPAFQAQRIEPWDLAKLYEVEQFSFLLNGWNEISEDIGSAHTALRELERDYRKAGICVATRTHHITPPLPGAFRAELLPLTRAQRNEYLKATLEARADELGSKLDNDPVLDQLTQTPLILSEVIKIFQSGRAIPPTRIGVLREVIRLMEESDAHRNDLRTEPLTVGADHYLADLAVKMTEQGTTIVLEGQARPIAKLVSIGLKDAGQIERLPEPGAVLVALSSHHVLERLIDQPDAFRFEHQQFQEFYAALFLKRSLLDLVAANTKERDRTFAGSYVNDSKWEEVLRMIAEDIGALSREKTDGDEVVLGKRLVEVAFTVDPIFAAELSRLCGGLVWKGVGTAIGERLRSWYSTNEENHRQCALAGMIASGSGDFADIILPLLKSDDSQVRLGTYRAGAEFHPTVLGEDWGTIVNGWSEEARIEFVSELAMNGSNIERFDVVERFARTDPSPKVRAEASHGLIWTGSSRVLGRVLEALDDEAFELVVQELDTRNIPPTLRPRALAVWEQRVEQSSDPASQVADLLVAKELGAVGIPERLKQQLGQLKNTNLNNLGTYVIRPALGIIGKADPIWVSHWVADRILDGSLWSDGWINFVTTIPDQLKQELLETIGSHDLQAGGRREITPVLIAIADVSLAEKVFERLFEVHRAASDLRNEPNTTDRSIVLQLEKLLVGLPPDIAVAGLSNCLGREPEAVELSALIELFSRTDAEGHDLRAELTDGLRQRLRAYLKKGVALVLDQDDFNGQAKAYLATALARVGEPEDIVDLRRLIRGDIERISNGRLARLRHEPGPMAQGVGNCWAHWHVRALTLLDPDVAEEELLELLDEPEWERYEIEAATALVRLATTDFPEEFAHRIDYRRVWAARAGSQPTRFDEERRRRYANAISLRITTLLSERANSTSPTRYDGRLKELAKLLALLDGRGSSELIMKVLALPGEWDASVRVKALEALLLSGTELPTERALEILNPAIAQIQAQGISDHNGAWLLVRCMCLLPFLDVPAVGIDRIRQVLAETSLWPSALRDLLGALGASRSEEALPLLLELAGPDGTSEAKVSAEWINAVSTLATSDSRRVLMSFIEPEDDGLELWNIEHDHSEGDVLASSIADLGRVDTLIKDHIFQLCAERLPTANRLLLSKVIARLETAEAVLAGLNLINDSENPSVPYDLRKAIENLFLERRPYRETGSYTLVGRNANAVRAKLFEMSLNDDHRRQSAFALLRQIEVWRLEYARPSDEPRHPDFDSSEPN